MLRALAVLALSPLLLACPSGTPSSATPQPPTGTLAFVHARVFDGQRTLPDATVVVQRGLVVAVTAGAAPPADATVIDAAGKTLMPGMIDAHAHVNRATDLTQALAFGVTTELDMLADPKEIDAIKRVIAREATALHADLRSSGFAATCPGGHGTEYGMAVPTLTAPAQARAWVAARLAEGSDYVKLISDDGSAYGFSQPTLDAATFAAVVAATHAVHKLAVAHIGTLADARAALTAGVDGLAHLFIAPMPDAGFGAFVAAHHAFVVPTLAILHTICEAGHGQRFAADPRITAGLSPEVLANLARPFPPLKVELSCEPPAAAIAQLVAARVPILTGTDAPNPGSAHGATLHEELALLVAAGLTPSQALTAATAAPAAAFHLDDRGRIAPGLRADLVLVDGDPTRDITATRSIVGIWRGGARFDRDGYLAARARERSGEEQRLAEQPARLAAGAISDFDDGRATTWFGQGWGVSTDAIASGKSTATMTVVSGGAGGSSHALAVAGTIAAGAAFPWAGIAFMVGAHEYEPVDLSTKRRLRFQARGDGKTYRAMFFSASTGFQPAITTFVAPTAWSEVSVDLAKVAGLSSKDVTMIVLVGGPATGAFAFQIDGVALE